MIDQFIITYHQVPEPGPDGPVVAATITLPWGAYHISVARRDSGWTVQTISHYDDLVYRTFDGALSAAHLSAYLYASDLVSAIPRRAYG